MSHKVPPSAVPPNKVRASHQIFGHRVNIIGNDSNAFRLLIEELAGYPAAPDNLPEVEIRYSTTSDPGISPISFDAKFTSVNVSFLVDPEKRVASFSIRHSRNPLVELIRKWRFSQFSDRTERIGMIFHENVLIPMFFFVRGMLPVHGAGVVGGDGKAILFGGGGGTGKTTMELELCRKHGYSFLCDDFAVVHASGMVYPNLAFPKIYGYNLVGNSDLQKLLLDSQGFLDRIHWRMKKRQGLDQVRRRFSPSQLYRSVNTTEVPFGTYVFLERSDIPSIEIVQIEPSIAVDLTIDVIKSEYDHFFQPLQNDGISLPVGEWRSTLHSALNETRCLRASIPSSMDNKAYRSSLIDALSLAQA